MAPVCLKMTNKQHKTINRNKNNPKLGYEKNVSGDHPKILYVWSYAFEVVQKSILRRNSGHHIEPEFKHLANIGEGEWGEGKP